MHEGRGKNVWSSNQERNIEIWRVARKRGSLLIMKLEMSAQNVPFLLLGRLNQGFSSLDIAPKVRQRESIQRMRGIIPTFLTLRGIFEQARYY